MLNPATQEVLAKVPKAGAAETRAAIAEANAVFPMWKSQPAKKRADVMKKCVMSHCSLFCNVSAPSGSAILNRSRSLCDTSSGTTADQKPAARLDICGTSGSLQGVWDLSRQMRVTPSKPAAGGCWAHPLAHSVRTPWISGTAPHAHHELTCRTARRWHQLVMDNLDDIAIIMSAEAGKPVKEAKAEATGGCVRRQTACQQCLSSPETGNAAAPRYASMVQLGEPSALVEKHS